MVEGIGLFVLGAVMCGGASFRRHHPSWGSARSYFLGGVAIGAVGLGLAALDIVL